MYINNGMGGIRPEDVDWENEVPVKFVNVPEYEALDFSQHEGERYADLFAKTPGITQAIEEAWERKNAYPLTLRLRVLVERINGEIVARIEDYDQTEADANSIKELMERFGPVPEPPELKIELPEPQIEYPELGIPTWREGFALTRPWLAKLDEHYEESTRAKVLFWSAVVAENALLTVISIKLSRYLERKLSK